MLALALGKTVRELHEGMSKLEFERWRAFYELFPFDDFHRFHRPAALIARDSNNVRELLEWLQPDPALHGMTDADINTMRAFGFARPGG